MAGSQNGACEVSPIVLAVQQAGRVAAKFAAVGSEINQPVGRNEVFEGAGMPQRIGIQLTTR